MAAPSAVRGRTLVALVVAIATTIIASNQSGADTMQTASEPTPRSNAQPFSCTGVKVSPIDNVQAMFGGRPRHTTFCFAPGIYILAGHVRPKSYDRLISVVPRKAILTGLGTYDGGIVGSGGPDGEHNVLVQGFIIRKFVNSWSAHPRSALQAGDNWTIRDNEIAHNTQAGVQVNNGTRLLGNWIHGNGRYGFEGGPLKHLLVANNDVSSNNTSHYDPNNDAGGSKIIKSSGVVFRGNRVHDNYGNGLWTDWANTSVLYEDNVLTHNYMAGIFHEASANAVAVRDNRFERNGTYAAGHSLWWSADLLLNDSKNTQIYGNTIVAGVNGIGLVDFDRGSNRFGTLEIRNVSVHDNVITLPAGGTSGVVGRMTAAKPTANVHFKRNTYRVADPTATRWMWPHGNLGVKTWMQWRLAGNDSEGRLFKSS